MSLVHSVKPLLFAGSLVLNLSVLYFYYLRGFSLAIFVLWLASLFLAGAHFFYRDDFARSFKFSLVRRDLIIVVGLLLLVSPLYLYRVYEVPHQINTDEIHIGDYFEKAATMPSPDLFGLSDYFDFPFMIFYVMGKLERALGGFDFYHARLAHALFGIVIVIPAYFMFRVYWARLYAAGAVLVLVTSHALLALSRMVGRYNVLALNVVTAFLFLMLGVKRRSPFYLFLGGVVAGLSWYQYSPARLLFPVWGVFLFVLFVVYQREISFRRLLLIAVVSGLGFLMTAGPNLLALSKLPNDPNNYGRQQFLIYPEGRAHQQLWYGAATTWEGMEINIRQGFAMFNSTLHDQAYIYPNYNHGLLDPLSGILLWVGIGLILLKSRKNPMDWLMLSGFFVSWAVFMFIVGKTPNYTRLVIILPFVSYFVVAGFEHLSFKSFRRVGIALFIFSIVSIVALNLNIFGSFVRKGFSDGNDVGGTGRYIESRKAISGYSYYVVANELYPYYSWGVEGQWYAWTRFFTNRETQRMEVLSPVVVDSYSFERPFTLFMNEFLWQEHKETLTGKYSDSIIHPINPNGSLVAVEVR